MLFMIIVKSSKNSETGNKPNLELMKQMDQYNDELDSAGVKVMAKGLRPSSIGHRISFNKENKKPIITKGPFENPKDIIAGFFLIDVKDYEEALQWALKAPDPQGDGEGEIELRQLY